MIPATGSVAFVPSRWSQFLPSQTAASPKEIHLRINWSGRGLTFRAQVSAMMAAPCPAELAGLSDIHADGRFHFITTRTDAPKLASSDPARPTPEEAMAIASGSIAYTGTLYAGRKHKDHPRQYATGLEIEFEQRRGARGRRAAQSNSKERQRGHVQGGIGRGAPMGGKRPAPRPRTCEGCSGPAVPDQK